MNISILTNSITVYVPYQVATIGGVRAALDATTKAAGGCTVVDATGVWFDENGDRITDTISKCTWWYSQEAAAEVRRTSRDLVAEIAEHEKCVMSEMATLDSRRAIFFDKN